MNDHLTVDRVPWAVTWAAVAAATRPEEELLRLDVLRVDVGVGYDADIESLRELHGLGAELV